MQQFISIFAASLILPYASFAETNAVLAASQRAAELAITKVLPSEFAIYRSELKGDNGSEDASSCLELLSKAKESLKQSLSNHGQEKDTKDNIDAYRATWALALRMMQISSDPAAQQHIRNEWNDSLRADDESVPPQIYTLADHWDRSLLTDDFWQLLHRTGNKKTVSAVCYVLYKHGTKSDAGHLVQKRNSGIDVDLQETIQNAINWMDYKRSGDKTNPGPAAAPPRPE